ncbi:MAG: nucleoside deaminase [bacterium]
MSANESSNHERWMREAIELSLNNVESGNGGPFAALIVKEGVVLARGINRVTSSNDPTAHAEIVAIREACRILNSFQLQGCEIYSSCEPCPMCLGAIYWTRPKALYFAGTRIDAARVGFDDHLIYQELTVPIQARTIPTQQLLGDEAQSAFIAWERKSDKVQY